MKMENGVLTEVPGSLKQLARLVVRGFYSPEHVILIDMLVRNPCMKEDDLVDLLKFERKQLRSIIAQLKNDKFIKVRLRMETGPEGKATRQNYYFINYKVLVNVVKYKLDHMRRKIDTAERDSTSRASFKCPTCLKSFTDLEADQLCDFTTGEFHCTFCHTMVEEDQSALPKQDSRLLLAKFNDQIEPLYVLLREVEDIKLAPEILEPEPTDVSDLKRDAKPRIPGQMPQPGDGTIWSGDSTRNRDFGMEHDVTISFGDEAKSIGNALPKKERPIWMTESTVAPEVKESSSLLPEPRVSATETPSGSRKNEEEDIMQVLLAHEKKSGNSFGAVIPGAASENESDTSESDAETPHRNKSMPTLDSIVGEMGDDDEDEEVVMVTVGNVRVPIHEVNEELVVKMTPALELCGVFAHRHILLTQLNVYGSRKEFKRASIFPDFSSKNHRRFLFDCDWLSGFLHRPIACVESSSICIDIIDTTQLYRRSSLIIAPAKIEMVSIIIRMN